MKHTFLTAEWKNLVMANYVIDPSLLTKHLPYKTELELFNGKVYVSLVGFMFTNTRLKGFRIPFHVNFEEVNLRFYVRHNDNGAWKRGVVFIKEIVPKAAISLIANTFYKEKYCRMPMRNFCTVENDRILTGYQWKKNGNWNKLNVVAENKAIELIPGSEAEFICEHYWGYSKYNGHTTNEYEVQHPSWKVYPVKSYIIDCDFEKLYGTDFSFLKTAVPTSVFMAAGSAVSISNKNTLK